MAEASHNRVLVVQLISLQHVSWPRRNPTLNAKVARRVNDVHRELLNLIEMRDPTAARHLMDDHVKMIRARRWRRPPVIPGRREAPGPESRTTFGVCIWISGSRARARAPE